MTDQTKMTNQTKMTMTAEDKMKLDSIFKSSAKVAEDHALKLRIKKLRIKKILEE